MIRHLPTAAVLVALAVAGCGYRAIQYPGFRGERVNVAVGMLANDSFDPGYEFVVTDALREEFARRGALRLVDDPTVADLILNGRIQRVSTRRRSFSSVVLTLEYQVDVAMELEVLRGQGEEQERLGIDRRVLQERELYLASADVEAARKNREEALRRIAGGLASRIHDVVYELAP